MVWGAKKFLFGGAVVVENVFLVDQEERPTDAPDRASRKRASTAPRCNEELLLTTICYFSKNLNENEFRNDPLVLENAA